MATTSLRRLLATALFAAPLPLAAQSVAPYRAQAPIAPLVQAGMLATPSAAPVVNATRVGLSRSETAVRLDAAAEADRLNRRITKRDSQLLMIVGGAAFVAGLLIGDDVGTVFAVGGATAGLIGLYNYLK
ncbi:MAG: hypothetical protein MUF40_01025 [Gemmatimonadaceae bacterium]|jgi:hypothetical protein|nr:hypothetical protein [Gemmatimonadaceae bacterium]